MLTFGYDVETTGVNPFENKLITIQYRRNSRNHIFKIWDYNDSERDLILNFFEDWKNIPRHLLRGGDYFITYNFRLDGPFLLTRCILNNLGVDKEWRKQLWNILIHGPDFVDIDQLLGDKLTSFEHWTRKFGLRPNKFKNSDVPKMYQDHRYKDIEEYICDELVSLEKIYRAISREPFYVELEKLRKKLMIIQILPFSGKVAFPSVARYF